MNDTYDNFMISQLAQLSGVNPEIIKQIVAAVPGSRLSVDHGLISENQYETLEAQALGYPVAKRKYVKLYKYFSDMESQTGVNYSRLSLRNNTVHLSNPNAFNDPFDCQVNIDSEKATVALLQDIALHFNIEIDTALGSKDLASVIAEWLNNVSEAKLPHLSSLHSDTSAIRLQLLYLALLTTARSRGSFSPSEILAVTNEKINEEINFIRKCRVACFTSNAYNLYMWAHYANKHRGFCIEYDIPEAPYLAWDELSDSQHTLLCNIFGVYYTPTRQDNTDLFIQMLTGKIGPDTISKLYAEVLCTKSPDWMLEQEYRLIIQDQDLPSEMPFFPSRKVYLGARMPDDSKQEIMTMLDGTKTRVVQMQLSNDTYSLETVMP